MRREPFKVYHPSPREPYKVDRKRWHSGPWDDEPEDRSASWTTESGLTGVMVRGGYGVWCGYVRVPKGHRLYRSHYNRANNHVDVHGGLTFGSIGRTTSVCTDRDLNRMAYGGRKGRSTRRRLRREWWFGFDCGHMFDSTPLDESYRTGNYRTTDYVRAEVEKLATQLKEMAS
jgi:hypothetical protein